MGHDAHVCVLAEARGRGWTCWSGWDSGVRRTACQGGERGKLCRPSSRISRGGGGYCRKGGLRSRRGGGCDRVRWRKAKKRGCSAAMRCVAVRCCGNGGNLLEWGGARESMVPFIIRYCHPEAVNDNDARARRGEGRTGRTRRDETGRDRMHGRRRSCCRRRSGSGWALELGPLTF